jgi:Protein of unknown function (DUF4435)
MALNYSPKSAKALAYLKGFYNDVEIFVEDKRSMNMWVSLLRVLLPTNTKLISVNMLGGRDAVTSACRLDQEDSTRRRLYIVDGDFDFALGKPKLKLKHLYRLRAYCIENLLISEAAVVQLGTTLQPDLNESQIQAKFGFSNWLTSSFNSLAPLFCAYAVAEGLKLGLKTVKRPVNDLFLNTREGPSICPFRARSARRSIAKQAIKLVGPKKFRSEVERVIKNLHKIDFKSYISGKDYLFPVFFHRICKVLSFKGTIDQLKVALAKLFDRSQEPYFARRLANL